MQKELICEDKTLCAWCGKELNMGYHASWHDGDKICKKCYMFAFKVRRKDRLFWKGVKNG